MKLSSLVLVLFALLCASAVAKIKVRRSAELSPLTLTAMDTFSIDGEQLFDFSQGLDVRVFLRPLLIPQLFDLAGVFLLFL